MKIFKIVLYIIILLLLAIFVLENYNTYFRTVPALQFDLRIKNMNYSMPFPNWAYWSFCLVLGLLITGIRGLITSFRLSRQVKTRNERIEHLKGEINSLKTRLDIFAHDPYIKKHLEEEARKEQEQAQAATVGK